MVQHRGYNQYFFPIFYNKYKWNITLKNVYHYAYTWNLVSIVQQLYLNFKNEQKDLNR